MDVKFINPFVNGTVATMKKIAFMDIQPGKVYLRESNVAAGDVSGIIGITGDATGSLSISFTEACICNIVSAMRGERHTAVDRIVFDGVREIAAMILAVAGTYIEKAGMKIYAALPTVVCGKGHTIEPMLDCPSITIPFSTEDGTFVVDICLKTLAAETSKTVPAEGTHHRPPGNAVDTTISEVKPVAEHDCSEIHRKELLQKQLAEAISARNELTKQLADKPFMEMSQRTKFKKMIPALEAKVKRLKLDITALEMIARINSNELENPVVPNHYQHYDNNKKR